MDKSQEIIVPSEVLRAQLTSVFTAWGMTAAHVATTVEIMVETDLTGVDSHGVGMLPTYDRHQREGKVNAKPDIRVVMERPSLGLIDADQSLGHPPSHLAMTMAIHKAKATGIGVVGVRNSNHFGPAGYYSLMAARQGVIGIAMTNASTPLLVPTFGREPRLGTNPIAFAAPAKRNNPFHLDMATTTVAFGKINIARRAKKPLPEGWALTSDGAPLGDSQQAFEMRRLTPLGGTRELGGHKGYGLATMVEILCATLTGAWMVGIDPATGERSAAQTNTGHFFLALNPDMLRAEGEFGDDLDRLIDMLRATPPADPARPVLVAGDPEYATHAERTKTGIPLTDTLFQEVRAVAQASGVPFLLGN